MKLVKIVSIILLIVTAFAATCVLGACAPQNPDEMIIGTVAVIDKATRDEYNYDVLSASFSQLAPVSISESGEVLPLLCEYEQKDKTLTLTVKDGMTWEDGQKVTAEDILYTLQYLDSYDGKTYLIGEQSTYTAYNISSDKTSITLTMRTANVREVANLATLRIMPKHIYQGNETTVTAEQSRIGCGPYKFLSFDKAAGVITFVPNEYYPEGQPNVKKVYVRLFAEQETLVMALNNGEVDVIWRYSGGIDSTYVDVLKQNSNLTIKAVSATNLPAVITFNNSKAPFDDINVRQAVMYALDYDTFRSTFSSEYGSVPYRGVVPSTTVGFVETEQLQQNLQKSTDLLAKSGYVDKDSQGYLTKAGKRLSFTLVVNSTKELQVRCADLVKQNLKEIGVEVNVMALPTADYQAATTNKFGNGNPTHQAAIMGYTSAGMAMGGGLGSIYVYGAHDVQGCAQVFDKDFEDIYNALTTASTMKDYLSAAQDCQQWYSDNTPVVPLYCDVFTYAYSSRFDGFVTDGNFGIINVASWYSVKITK